MTVLTITAKQSAPVTSAIAGAEAEPPCALQVLHSMLERELWKKLPMAQGTFPDLASALGGTSQNGLLAKTGSSSSLSASSTTASQNGIGATNSDGFDAYLAQGNPWRASQGQSALQCHAVLHWGVMFYAALCCAVLCRAVPCRAVPCRAVPCRAVLCRAVLCCAVICRLWA